MVGAITFTWLHDTVARTTDYWRAMLGGIILLLVLLFPQGIAGFIKQMAERWRPQKPQPPAASGNGSAAAVGASAPAAGAAPITAKEVRA